MGITVTDTMLALRAEVYPGQEMRDISIGEFSLRLADELANNKVDGDIVRPTQGKRTIYPALIDVQEASESTDFGGHRLLPIGKKENGKPRQRRCSCCKEKTSYYCSSPKCSLLWGPFSEPRVCAHLQSFYSWLLSPASPEGTRSRSRDERTNR